MKYRIVKLKNQFYKIQEQHSLGIEWVSYQDDHAELSDAIEFLDYLINSILQYQNDYKIVQVCLERDHPEIVI